jgi:hypothetical protein
MTLLSSYRTCASRVDSSLGGGSPAYTATFGGVLGAGKPPDAVSATVEDHLSCLPIANFPCSVLTAVSSQTGSSHPLDHVGRNHVVFGALYLKFELSLHQPWHPGGSVWPGRAEEGDSPEPSDLGWTIEIRTKITLHFI